MNAMAAIPEISYLVSGLVLGLSAGISPGPLLTLVMTQTLNPVLGSISLFGAGYLFYLGYESFIFRGTAHADTGAAPHSFRKGVVANFLNPSPYMFWLSVGGPLTLKAFHLSMGAALLFVVSFYSLLVGAKCLVAVISGRSRHFLKSGYYVYTVRVLGLVLCLFGLLFVRDALRYFSLI